MARIVTYLFFAVVPILNGWLGTPTAAEEINNKGDTSMEFPSFEPVPMSPEVADLGVAVALGAAEFKVGEPVALFGSYVIDGEFMQQCHGEPDTWIFIIVVRRDQPAVWVKRVLEKPNLAPVPPPEEEPPGPTVRSGGFFNLDLREHLGLPDEPGRYWLMVSMGDYVTERIPFTIRE